VKYRRGGVNEASVRSCDIQERRSDEATVRSCDIQERRSE
jgi:hypothetical protein